MVLYFNFIVLQEFTFYIPFYPIVLYKAPTCSTYPKPVNNAVHDESRQGCRKVIYIVLLTGTYELYMNNCVAPT